MTAVAFGERLRDSRAKAKLSARDLADRVGVSQSYVSLLESGARVPSRMSYSVARRLAETLGVDPDWLMGEHA